MAFKVGMPVGTFKNKLSERQTAYKFTDEETEKLKDVLMDMSDDIRDLCGMTFNEALKQIVGK